jgi:hypothetical protein
LTGNPFENILNENPNEKYMPENPYGQRKS